MSDDLQAAAERLLMAAVRLQAAPGSLRDLDLHALVSLATSASALRQLDQAIGYAGPIIRRGMAEPATVATAEEPAALSQERSGG